MTSASLHSIRSPRSIVHNRSHLLPERRDRDDFVNAVFAESGLPDLRVKAQGSYSVAELRKLFATQSIVVRLFISAGLRAVAAFAPDYGAAHALGRAWLRLVDRLASPNSVFDDLRWRKSWLALRRRRQRRAKWPVSWSTTTIPTCV